MSSSTLDKIEKMQVILRNMKSAISREHAACAVADIRETAWLGDEIVG